jgi:hypothetical protein
MTAEVAALAYKGLLRVEQSFRTLKHGVDIRPGTPRCLLNFG